MTQDKVVEIKINWTNKFPIKSGVVSNIKKEDHDEQQEL